MSGVNFLTAARTHASAALEAFRLIPNMTRAATLACAVEELLPLLESQALDLAPAVLARNYDLTSDELRTVLDALDVAADAKRDAADVCPDCDARPDRALCGTCEWRLTVADEYNQLAEKLRSQQ